MPCSFEACSGLVYPPLKNSATKAQAVPLSIPNTIPKPNMKDLLGLMGWMGIEAV